MFVEDDIDGVVFEIGPNAGEKIPGLLPHVHIRVVADTCLALVDALVVGDLVLLAARDVADLLEAEQNRVVVPDVDRLAHDGVQWLSHI